MGKGTLQYKQTKRREERGEEKQERWDNRKERSLKIEMMKILTVLIEEKNAGKNRISRKKIRVENCLASWADHVHNKLFILFPHVAIAQIAMQDRRLSSP